MNPIHCCKILGFDMREIYEELLTIFAFVLARWRTLALDTYPTICDLDSDLGD
jgi:hypothetical protein